MGLLEDLNSGKYNLVLFGILFIFMFHQYWCASSNTRSRRQSWCASCNTRSRRQSRCASCKTKEPMADVSVDIKEAVKQVYLADVEAIRNLSEIATKLQNGALTIPGNLVVKGQIRADNAITSGGEISNNNFSLSGLNSKIDGVQNSLNNTVSNVNNNFSSIKNSLDNKLNNNGQVTIEIQPQAGRSFNWPGHKLFKRTYDGLNGTWNNPNDIHSLYNWKLTAV
jgi:hypothetical protein